jgi:hypothetical protein
LDLGKKSANATLLSVAVENILFLPAI